MHDPKVLTVILNYRTADLTLQAAAAAVRAMRHIAGAITIVDNNSQDGSADRITAVLKEADWAKNGRVRFIAAAHNGGYGAGNNIGIRAGLPDGSRPDYVYILNPDAQPEEDAIHHLLTALKADPQAAFAGSRVQGPDGQQCASAFRFPTIWSEIDGGLKFGPLSRLLKKRLICMPPLESRGPVDWLSGASLMMRQEALDDIGLFDENFFLYFDETELCWRARRAGWRVLYVPESRVTHEGSASTGMKTWSRTPQYWFDSRLYYFVKCHGPTYAAGATLAHVLGAMIWHVRRFIQQKPLYDPPHFVRDLATHAVRTALFRLRSCSSVQILSMLSKQTQA